MPTDTQLNAEVWKARAQASTIKRDNLWAILDVNNGFVNASKVNVRAGFERRCYSCSNWSGWRCYSTRWIERVNVLNACTRDAKVIEQVLNTGNQTTGTVTAAIMGYVGDITKGRCRHRQEIQHNGNDYGCL